MEARRVGRLCLVLLFSSLLSLSIHSSSELRHVTMQLLSPQSTLVSMREREKEKCSGRGGGGHVLAQRHPRLSPSWPLSPPRDNSSKPLLLHVASLNRMRSRREREMGGARAAERGQRTPWCSSSGRQPVRLTRSENRLRRECPLCAADQRAPPKKDRERERERKCGGGREETKAEQKERERDYVGRGRRRRRLRCAQRERRGRGRRSCVYGDTCAR